jgi:hydrogenase-4 membrane subunit HyfE
MDTTFFLNFLSEIAYFLIVFGVLFTLAIFKGRQAIINIIIALYFALLISIEFPFYNQVLTHITGAMSVSAAKLSIFLVFTLLATILCFRIMPDEFREMRLESISKKFIHALLATVLVMIFSFNVLPVTEFLTPGTPLQSLFAPKEYFFWWLILPLIGLFIL